MFCEMSLMRFAGMIASSKKLRFRAVGRPGRRIVDAEARVQREHLAEVAVPHLRGRHGVGVEDALPFRIALPRSEVEELVAPDRPASGAAIIDVLASTLLGSK